MYEVGALTRAGMGKLQHCAVLVGCVLCTGACTPPAERQDRQTGRAWSTQHCLATLSFSGVPTALSEELEAAQAAKKVCGGGL